MSRSVYDYTINKPDDFIQFVSNDYFGKEGFRLINYKGEQVWKRGNGMVTAANYMKLQYGNGIIHIEAWIRYFGEQNLDGFVGVIPKSQLKDRVTTLVNLLNQPVAVPNNAPIPQPVGAAVGGAAGGQNLQPESPDLSGSRSPQADGVPPPSQQGGAAPYAPPQPIQVQVHNPTGQATLSLVMGILSIILPLIPIFGIIAGGVGIAAGRSGRTSTKKGMATAGLVMSIIGLVLSIGSILINVLAVMGGML